MQRYARQTVFSRIGEEGQKKLEQSKVTIIGMGALGTVSANNLCRSGIGYIRMVDRDYVELSNLQRQILFNEDDARQNLPKAVAAFNHLSKVNSDIALEPVVTDVNPSNIESLISGADLVLDATDNWEIRFLMNEACHKHNIPWIYCAALGSHGMTMNILPGKDNPCLRCFVCEDQASPAFSCSTFGVMNMITGTMASIQTMEAIKILLHSDQIRKELFTLDLWENQCDTVNVLKNNDCPVCVHQQYDNLAKAVSSYTASLCGSNSIQVVPPHPVKVDFSALAEKLKKAGSVRYNQYILTFSDTKYEIILFPDGRAMIKNAIDGNNAKSVYTEYIGL
jgi:adenylyltransferase/sulfurtransferase